MFLLICPESLKLYCDLSAEVSSPEPVQQSFSTFQNRWEDVNTLLRDRKRKLEQAVRHQEFETELKRLQKAVEPVERWLDEDMGAIADDLQRIKMQLDQCRVSGWEVVMRVMMMMSRYEWYDDE